MSITANDGRIIVGFRFNHLYGAPAIGGYLLKFSLNYRVPNRDDDALLFKNISAKVFMGPEKGYLGRALPEMPVIIKHTTHDQSGSVLFEIILSSQQIEKIEQERKGADIQFTLTILGECYDERNKSYASDDVNCYINQKEWIDALKQMNFGNFLLYELPINISDDESLNSALKAFNKAKEHLYYGNYEEVVAQSRLALEKILSNVSNLKEVRQLFKENKKSMTKYQRIMHVIDAIRHCTHLAHHLDNEGEYISFSRAEAIFILGVTATAISSVGEIKI